MMLFSKEEWKDDVLIWGIYKHTDIPSTTICRNCMLSIFVYQISNNILCNKHVSFCWKINIKNWFVVKFDCNPSPEVVIAYFDLCVSSITSSETFLRLYDILSGLYLWIQFQTATWLRFTNLHNAFAVFLYERPRKYKYRP